MKRSLYLLIGLPLLGALTACSSDSGSEVSPADKAAVQFRAADVLSRATVTTNDNLTSHNFKVWGDKVSNSQASTTAPSTLFEGVEVSYSGSAWSYSDQQYWFPGNTYSFVALHPSDAADANYENSGIKISYEYPNAAPDADPNPYKDVKDIVVATHTRKYEFGKGKNTVDFRFRHIFSRLNFVAIYDNSSPDNSGVTINWITLRGVGTKATFAIAPATIASSEPVGTMTDDAGTASASMWSTPTATGTIFYSKSGVTLNATNNRHEFFPVGSDPLMVIPQTLTGEVEVVINYTPSNQAPKEVISYLLPAAVASHGGIWLPGQSYTYSFTVGADEIIIFNTPVMEEWNESEGANFII